MRTREKGTRFEREVADTFTAAGYTVRGLESAGDHLILAQDGSHTFASESKRHERLRIPEWWAQTIRDAPAGTIPVLTFRQSRREMLTVIRTADLLRLVGGGGGGGV